MKKPSKKQEAIDRMAGAEVKSTGSDTALARVAEIAQQQLDIELECAQLEDQLRDAKARLLTVSRTDLPEAMREAGMLKFTTQDEYEISVKDEVSCSIPSDKSEAAFKWLEDHNFAGIIKTDVTVKFGKEEEEEAKELAMALTADGCDASFAMKVAPQTLKAFIKERLADAEGPAIPLDLFGAFPYSVAVIKPTKKRKQQTGA